MFSKEQNLSNKNEQRSDLLSDKYAPFNHAFNNVWKETLLLAIGNVFVLSLVSTIVSLMLFSFNELDKFAARSLITYSIIFVALVIAVGFDFKKFIPKLKSWVPYVTGLAFGITILVFDSLYIRVVNLFYNTGIGGNEFGIRQVIQRYPAASFFIFGLIGPMCEELTYRVGMFNLLKRWHRIPAYILTAIVFGLIHIQYDGNLVTEFIILPTYIAPGVLLALAYDLYDLPCSYTAHITNNLFVIITQIVALKS